jgi:cell division protein FtsZ
LTVGIVTIPFIFEGERKILQALNGVEEISKNVDALLVINNERLREIYPELTVMNAFGKADDTLTVAAKSIAEIITLPGIINLDFADVNTTMKDGGVALMSNGYGAGEGRVRKAVKDALNSPLLSNNDVKNARKILFNVSFSEKAELRMEEMNDVHNFMSEFNRNIDVIWGTAIDNSLGDQVKMTILATGFTTDDIPQIAEKHRTEVINMTEAEIEAKKKRDIEEQKKQKLIDKYYGNTAQSSSHFFGQYKLVVLSDEELDNDAFITIMEENPTYDRDPKVISNARALTVPEPEVIKVEGGEDQPVAQKPKDEPEDENRVISFR